MDSETPDRLPRFRRYDNLSGQSGVLAYSLLARGIAVRFGDGSVYLYDADCPGPLHVSRMKELARAGTGLSTYISRHVGRRYSTRLDEAAAGRARHYDTRQNTAFR